MNSRKFFEGDANPKALWSRKEFLVFRYQLARAAENRKKEKAARASAVRRMVGLALSQKEIESE